MSSSLIGLLIYPLFSPFPPSQKDLYKVLWNILTKLLVVYVLWILLSWVQSPNWSRVRNSKNQRIINIPSQKIVFFASVSIFQHRSPLIILKNCHSLTWKILQYTLPITCPVIHEIFFVSIYDFLSIYSSIYIIYIYIYICIYICNK